MKLAEDFNKSHFGGGRRTNLLARAVTKAFLICAIRPKWENPGFGTNLNYPASGWKTNSDHADNVEKTFIVKHNFIP